MTVILFIIFLPAILTIANIALNAALALVLTISGGVK